MTAALFARIVCIMYNNKKGYKEALPLIKRSSNLRCLNQLYFYYNKYLFSFNKINEVNYL